MDKHEDNNVALNDVELEQSTGGTQENCLTYQRQDRSLTYQRTLDGASKNAGFEYGGLNVGHAK